MAIFRDGDVAIKFIKKISLVKGILKGLLLHDLDHANLFAAGRFRRIEINDASLGTCGTKCDRKGLKLSYDKENLNHVIFGMNILPEIL